MNIIKQYTNLVEAKMDKSLLEAASIPAFIANDNSAALGLEKIIGGVRLQVRGMEVDRTRQKSRKNKEAIALADDPISPQTSACKSASIGDCGTR